MLQSKHIMLICFLVINSITGARIAVSGDIPGLPPFDYLVAPTIDARSSTALGQVVKEYGKITLSVDAMGTTGTTGTIQVEKPDGAKVRKAYMMSATTGWTNYMLNTGDVKILGNDIVWEKEISNHIFSYNYWADVTAVVKPALDSAATGIVNLEISEASSLNIDGEILAVIFDDPNQTSDNMVLLYFGAQDINGDSFVIDFGEPIDKTNPDFSLQYSLGISYGYQKDGIQQFSYVHVNGTTLTSSAGGEDDGESTNGGLITVGGIGDDPSNPADPNAPPVNSRSDDELYDLKPFVNQDDTEIQIDTSNPSIDDNILFAAVTLGATRSKNIVDVNIRLNTSNFPTTTEEKAPYENIVNYFADGLYEASNAAHKLGRVTFNPPTKAIEEVDINWIDECHPSAAVAGIFVAGRTVNMCDDFVVRNEDETVRSSYNFIEDNNHQRMGGYTLAHEWGHYYYALYDEYVGDESYDDIFHFPHSDDEAVEDSIMNSQWKARGWLLNHYEWLNFSVEKNNTEKNAQYRVYNAVAWETLTSPVSEDPRDGERVSLPKRPYYAELKDVEPEENSDARIDLQGDARSAVNISWAEETAAESRAVVPFEASLSSMSGQNITYPNPILLLAFVQKESLITDANVVGSVKLPDGTVTPVTFSDDGVPPDAQQGDGLYSAIFSGTINGVYTIQVDFDNNANTAKYVQSSFQPAIAIDGPAPIPGPVPVNENFLVNRIIQVSVSNAIADDHGNTPSEATAIDADNKAITGKIEFAKDKDLFKVTTPNEVWTNVRVSNMAFGMIPHVRIIASDTSTVLFDRQFESSQDNYLYFTLKDVLPGTVVYIEVSDVSDSASGGLYDLSVGKQLASEEVAQDVSCHSGSMTLGPITYPYQNNVLEQAEVSLNTSGDVILESGAKVAYEATTSIELNSGFKAYTGSVFSARIRPIVCGE